jgi:2-oxo-3-hexenedioate decarboxylase
LAEALATFTIALLRNGEVIDRGTGSDVLGNPLHALRHAIGVIEADPGADRIGAGEIVTTGTVTRAFPVAAGENWSTEVAGLPLEGMALTFS